MDLGVYFVYLSDCPGNMVNIVFIKPMSVIVSQTGKGITRKTILFL
jgi:hypothetical protein